MGKTKVLVKINPDGKYVCDLDTGINMEDCKPNLRVALRSDSYKLVSSSSFLSLIIYILYISYYIYIYSTK